jgi:hypothetical protein
MAAGIRMGKKEKIEINRRGIVFREEGDEGMRGGEIPLRVGQCWLKDNKVVEIVGFDGENCEVIKWEGKGIKEGVRVKMSSRKNYEGYATGMGSKTIMSREEVCSENRLVELGKDSIKGREASCEVRAIREKRGILKGEIVYENRDYGWRKWEGKTIKGVYTDGSWKKTNSVGSMMLGGGKIKAGGAVVLAGENWYSPLFIEMDLETEGAYQTEVISLLAGCLAVEKLTIEVGTDCKGAMAAEQGKNRDVNRILGGWKRGEGITVKKIKAHPERRGGEWSKDDEGIFIADQIAGNVGNVPSITATKIIGEIARRGKIMVCGENGEPFIGNLRMRSSKEKLGRYWKRRDEYREERGRVPKWEGTNIGMSHKMMGKTKSLEDLSAVQRMASGKRWCNSWINTEMCQACGTGIRSEAHALRACGAEDMRTLRRGWTENIGKVIHKVKNRDLRGVMEETWMRMRHNIGGEMAMMGCFTPGWVETISKARMELREGG